MAKTLRSFLIAVLWASAVTGFAQSAPPTLWNKTIGGSRYDNLQTSFPTSDGGHIIGGWSDSQVSFDKSEPRRGNYQDYWVVKINASGVKQWDKTFGGIGTEYLYSVIQTSDGGYLLGGFTDSGIGYDKTEPSKGAEDFWLVKISANGTKQWNKTIGGNGSDVLVSMAQTADGGYILGGSSTSGLNNDKSEASKGAHDFWIVKTDASGNKIWDKTIGGSQADYLYAIQQTSDGGYIAGGTSKSPVSGDKSQAGVSALNDDYWLVKLDSTGTKTWDKTYSSSGTEQLKAMQQTPDGGYILGGQSNGNLSGDKSEASKGNVDYWIVKVNGSGVKQWDKTIGGSLADNFNALDITLDGGYILAGSSYSNISGDKSEIARGLMDYWIVKLDAAGLKQWDKTYGGSNIDELYSIHENPDGSLFLAGLSWSTFSSEKSQPSYGNNDYWVLKLKSPCADLTASLLGSCNNNNRSVTVQVFGMPVSSAGTYPWTLTYKVNGVTQTITDTGNSYTLASNITTTTNFTLVSIVSGYCTLNLSSSLLVKPIPLAPTGANAERCGPGTVTLSVTSGPAGSFYNWYNTPTGGTPAFINTTGILVTPNLTATKTYYVSSSNDVGCEGPRTAITVTIKPLPVVSVGPTQTICETAAPVQLTGFSPAGGTWSGPGVSATGLFTPSNSLTGNQALTYSVTQNGCTAAATQVITVQANPTVNAGPNQTIFVNSNPVQLTGFSPAGGAWSGTGVSSSGLFTPSASLVGMHTLTYTYSSNGCPGTATKQVTVPAAPAQPTITLIAPDTLMSNLTGDTYEWKFNNTLLSSTTRKIKAPATGTYAVRIINTANGPSVYSPDFSFVISGTKEVPESGIKLFPNPATGIITLELKGPSHSNILVYNKIGQCILSKTISSRETKLQLDLSTHAKGVYTLRVISGSDVLTKKIVLQ